MLPEITTEIPGPASKMLAAKLKKYECHNTTYLSESWPIFWHRAQGVNVWDEDGNRYLDLTAAFGVASLGHGFSAVSMQEQSHKLMHGMGDVHPTRLKVDLCELLSQISFERWGNKKGKSILSNSGFEAIESALKTAYLATGKEGVVAFQNAYHGLGYGALLASGMKKFKEPFQRQLASLSFLLDFPSENSHMTLLEKQLASLPGSAIGALLVEPIQGRAGIIVPPDGFLKMLKSWCEQNKVLLIADEIFTGFNRTGKLFACEWEGVIPDIICLGKSMSGGYPISACVGLEEIMDVWPKSSGEAMHTSTFLGNPVACAMALFSIREHLKDATTEGSLSTGSYLQNKLKKMKHPSIRSVRGRGMMQAMELEGEVNKKKLGGFLIEELLKKGLILLTSGTRGNTISFTPPFVITKEEIDYAVGSIEQVLDAI